MKCAACRPLLSKYVDGEATPSEARLVEEHIGGCERCTTELIQFRLVQSMLGQMPSRPPDPRLRARLFQAIEAYDAERLPQEYARPVPRPITIQPHRAPQRASWSWVGNLAGAFAVVLVVSSSLLLLNIARPPAAVEASPTMAVSVIQVPTGQPSPITASNNVPGPESTPVVGLGAHPSEVGMPRTATGTPAWRPAPEDGITGHAIVDAQFGYHVTYPPNWWSATAPSPDNTVLGRRKLAAWPLDDPQAGTPYQVTIDVLANPARLNIAQAQAQHLCPARYTQPVSYGGLQGVEGTDTSIAMRVDEVYLFEGAYIYRISYGAPLRYGGETNQAQFQVRWNEGHLFDNQILQSFQPASEADMARHPLGYAPDLVLRDGNLWASDPDGSHAHQLTKDGTVRAFSLAPDLSRVALVTAAGQGAKGAWGARIELLNVNGGARQVLWTANEVHDVAWYGAGQLMAITDDPGSAARPGLSLYRLGADLGGTQQRLASLAATQNATGLQVAPDRTWIAFLNDGTAGHPRTLYGVRPDGGVPGVLTPAGGTVHDVREFAWLAPDDATAPSGTEELAVLERQNDGPIAPYRLTLPAPASGGRHIYTPLVTNLNTGWQAHYLAVSPQGQVAFALFDEQAAWAGLWAGNALAPAPAAHRVTIPGGTSVPTALQWTADGSRVLLQTGGPDWAQVTAAP